LIRSDVEKRVIPLPEDALVVLDSEVVHGKRLGHKLGFPTANQQFAEGADIPRYGIYASTAEIDGAEYIAVSNVGTRPTVDGEGVNCETHVIDCDRDLYGKRIRVVLRAYLRPEMKFSSIEELRLTIAGDVERAREYFEKTQATRN
jgi:riboflavin kinase/FMN adenylyltransferase